MIEIREKTRYSRTASHGRTVPQANISRHKRSAHAPSGDAWFVVETALTWGGWAWDARGAGRPNAEARGGAEETSEERGRGSVLSVEAPPTKSKVIDSPTFLPWLVLAGCPIASQISQPAREPHRACGMDHGLISQQKVKKHRLKTRGYIKAQPSAKRATAPARRGTCNPARACPSAPAAAVPTPAGA